MTFDECQDALTAIRRQQKTRFPVVRVDAGGSIYRGRLRRADSDPENRAAALVPAGTLVLKDGDRGRETEIRIADIADGGIGAAE
jgi:hypothetical protein